ncbi:proton extrusion protein PcxA [Thermoleptolyngbya sp. M55_K2018_002]|uniref:proton extrusion protein PcxA n=1 Tax=Thermoleptolyngbya sp. M55_K2018_002 TaxID=2747808 RepID=UPI0019EEEDFA|nr:proton extrusion protein PcxA [Thermoleptolyngbya sp. M55_K2018_002]HIK40721.1 proton extrusion protein PcxA [Thermoleptolyngbya sp. M55_K2018_002]
MTNPIVSGVQAYLRFSRRWLMGTPERALDDAYEAALRIKALEDTYFGGDRISFQQGNYSSSARAYFQTELRKYLNIAKLRLAEFRTSSSILQSDRPPTEVRIDGQTPDAYEIDILDRSSLIPKKLAFVDSILARYADGIVPVSSLAARPEVDPGRSRMQPFDSGARRSPKRPADLESIADKTGVLPRSILRTADRIKRELDPNAEQEVMEDFYLSKRRTFIAVRLMLLLIILPLLTQQVTKNFLISPIVDHYRTPETTGAFLNVDIEDEAFDELRRFEERLRFSSLVGATPPLAEPEINTRLQEKARDLQLEAMAKSNNAVKNVFADIFSALVFGAVLLSSRREIEVLKSFMDEIVYGLSDSAKAFIIILLTDIFVGFHSPHGWEVLLEGVSRHFGIPESRDFIFLFIATFPVILDTIFKYWIFRYLNRISPSAVATYRNMNE